jgi:hypothetical protein
MRRGWYHKTMASALLDADEFGAYLCNGMERERESLVSEIPCSARRQNLFKEQNLRKT